MKFQIMILFIAVLSALNVVAQEGDKKLGDPIDVTDEKISKTKQKISI